MDAPGVLQYGAISISSRLGVNQGPLKLTSSGFSFKPSSAGAKLVEIKKDDIESLYWTHSSRGSRLSVRMKEGAPSTTFQGFKDKDIDSLREYATKSLGLDVKELPMSTQGHNWGALSIHNGSLMFTVGGKVALDVPLKDVTTAQQAKDDVVMELQVDDTAAMGQDVLSEMTFHVPPSNIDFGHIAEPAKAFLDQVLAHTDHGAASAEEAVCAFGDVAVLNPRGRFEVEMHLGHLELAGQTQNFKIRYASIQRIFILPKLNTPHTLVVISLDPPIRKGQTYYSHLLCQFASDNEEVTIQLDLTPEQLAAKKEKANGKLDLMMTGPVYEVFARALRGLSGAKISKPTSEFNNASGDGTGSSIRCSYKADDGHLYPLDRSFFYIHKPPMLLPFEEIESVEFARQGGQGIVASRTFDLVIHMKSDSEHQFRNINRTEWQCLFDFINGRKIKIENLNQAAQGPGGNAGGSRGGFAIGDDDDGRKDFDSEEDDEDFEAGDASSSEDMSDDGDNASADEEGSDDAEMIEEEGIPVDALGMAKTKKRVRESGTPGSSKKKKGGGGRDEGGDAKGGKKARKKKDKNAPKGALSAFMYFSNAMRNKVREENPGMAFGEVGKALGEKWKNVGAEEKLGYEEMAKADKERYVREMKAYKAKAAADGAAADDGVGADEEVAVEEEEEEL